MKPSPEQRSLESCGPIIRRQKARPPLFAADFVGTRRRTGKFARAGSVPPEKQCLFEERALGNSLATRRSRRAYEAPLTIRSGLRRCTHWKQGLEQDEIQEGRDYLLDFPIYQAGRRRPSASLLTHASVRSSTRRSGAVVSSQMTRQQPDGHKCDE